MGFEMCDETQRMVGLDGAPDSGAFASWSLSINEEVHKLNGRCVFGSAEIAQARHTEVRNEAAR